MTLPVLNNPEFPWTPSGSSWQSIPTCWNEHLVLNPSYKMSFHHLKIISDKLTKALNVQYHKFLQVPPGSSRWAVPAYSHASIYVDYSQFNWWAKLLIMDNDTLSDQQSKIPTSAFRKKLTKYCSTLICASTINLLLQCVISSLLDYFWPIIYALGV